MKPLPLAGLAALVVAFPALATDSSSTISVIQKDMSFSQAVVTLHVGDEVMWGNADDVDHNISVSGAGVEVDHGLQKPGHIIKQAFEVAGSYRVICHIHPKMKMTVIAQ